MEFSKVAKALIIHKVERGRSFRAIIKDIRILLLPVY